MDGASSTRRPDAPPPAMLDAAQVLALVDACAVARCAPCGGTGLGTAYTIRLSRDCVVCDGTGDAGTLPRRALSRWHAVALATLATALRGGVR